MTTSATRPGTSAVRIAENQTRQAVSDTPPASSPPLVNCNRKPDPMSGSVFTPPRPRNLSTAEQPSYPEKNERAHEPRLSLTHTPKSGPTPPETRRDARPPPRTTHMATAAPATAP